MMKIEVDLKQEPENAAEQIYEKLAELPLEVRKNLQRIVEEIGLIQPIKPSEIRNYAVNHSDYKEELSFLNDQED